MKPIFMEHILYPLCGRIGTFAAGTLLTYGVSVEHADAIGLGIGAALLVVCDLLTRVVFNRKGKDNGSKL